MEEQLIHGGEIPKYTTEQQEKIKEIVETINLQDNHFILQYGVEAQKNISSFADNMLSQVRAKDAGYVGEIMKNLMFKIKELNVDGLGPRKKGFLSRIPLLGSAVDEIEKFIAKYQKLSGDIENIVNELEHAKDQLTRDIIMFDHLYQKNGEYFQQLDMYIAAGKLKLQEIYEEVLPRLKEKGEQTNDGFDIQQYNDMSQLVNRFEKKLHDLQLSRTIAIQTAPQIRLIQNNNQVMVEKIQSSVLNTIPLWKNQIIIALGLLRQSKVLQLQKEVTETTNDMLVKNSEMLKDSTIGVAKEAERGIVEVETLKKVHEDLLHTIEEVIQIQAEGRSKRQEAEAELQNMERELKNKLMSM
ncbi:toxic anion resistance protein [Anaerosolibacter sp.]|uniref:toxic anion resistance protein n=1 Tax=Anaerosolibacter sp. TaxID=1872527 RepID=UPI0039EE6086